MYDRFMMSNKILSALRTKDDLVEVKITDKDLQKKVDEWAELKVKADKLQEELKALKPALDEYADELLPVLEALAERTAETDKYIVSIIKHAYDKPSPKYQKAFSVALTKVNAQTKSILEKLLSEHTSVTRVSAGYIARTKASNEAIDAVIYELDTEEVNLSEDIITKFKQLIVAIKKKAVAWLGEIRRLDGSIKELQKLSKNWTAE